MTIQIYTLSLISEGLPVRSVHFTSFYPFSGSSFDAGGTTISVQIVSFDDTSLCEFFDADGVLLARARNFESAV